MPLSLPRLFAFVHLASCVLLIEFCERMLNCLLRFRIYEFVSNLVFLFVFTRTVAGLWALSCDVTLQHTDWLQCLHYAMHRFPLAFNGQFVRQSDYLLFYERKLPGESLSLSVSLPSHLYLNPSHYLALYPFIHLLFSPFRFFHYFPLFSPLFRVIFGRRKQQQKMPGWKILKSKNFSVFFVC